MKKIIGISIILLATAMATSAMSASITTSAFANTNGEWAPVDYLYGYTFTISDTADATIFDAELFNATTDGGPSLIDRLSFNMDGAGSTPDLGVDFNIINVNPDWNFNYASGNVQFDYTGDADSPGDRIATGGYLTFQFQFLGGFTLPVDPFNIWTESSITSGVGIGGGEEFGQVGVSFQGIGPGLDSDLLTSNWETNPVPEPTTLILLGSGLAGVAAVRRKKRAS